MSDRVLWGDSSNLPFASGGDASLVSRSWSGFPNVLYEIVRKPFCFFWHDKRRGLSDSAKHGNPGTGQESRRSQDHDLTKFQTSFRSLVSLFSYKSQEFMASVGLLASYLGAVGGPPLLLS